MHIVNSTERYLDQLVVLFEEYRSFCDVEPNPKKPEKFLANLIRNEEPVIFIAVDETLDEVMGFVNLYPSYSTLALQRLWILNDLGGGRIPRKRSCKSVNKKVLDFATFDTFKMVKS